MSYNNAMRLSGCILLSGLLAASALGQDAPAAQPIFPAPDSAPVDPQPLPDADPSPLPDANNNTDANGQPIPNAVEEGASHAAIPETPAAIPAPPVEAEADVARPENDAPQPADASAPAPTAPANVRTGKSLDIYRSIIARNPFNLKDPPTAAAEPAKPPGPPEKKTEYYLTGISTVGFPRFPKVAYLMNKDPNKKEYAEKHINLRLGDRAGDIVLNEIDEEGRRVKVTLKNEQLWLSMKDNGVPAPAAAPIAPVGGVPGAGGVRPGIQPGKQVTPGIASVPPPGQNYSANNKATQNAGISTRRNPRLGNIGYGGPTQGQDMQEPPPRVEPAQQYLNMIANQELHRREGVPTPPIPVMTD